MNYEEFVKNIKEAKKIQRETGGITTELQVTRSPDGLKRTISKSFTCKHCGHSEWQFVKVTFKTVPERITIFEAGMLFSVFHDNKLPKDYADFHKCQHGRQFIDNIEKIEVH